ncbi:lysophosphatidic acid receptor 2 [Nematostella vectensis]|uniref:lysophosphatidic acid receptor 2 n=1 Tax=Nematostella vectensis TaxID=45351 RepID=UPI0020774175|nr:lysophosphatidic acid receptor 2 [Nematostella vectensis]
MINPAFPNLIFAVFLSIAIVIVVVNLLAIAVFLSKTFRVKKSTYLLANLTVADLLVGITILWFLASKNVISWSLHHMATGGSLLAFTSIAIERAYAILAPLKHRLLGKKSYIIAIALVWILPVINYSQTLFSEDAKNTLDIIGSSFGIAGPLFVLSCYLAIWIKVRFLSPARNTRQDASNAKLTVTLSLVTLVSMLCYLPYCVTSWLDSLAKNVPKSTFSYLSMLLYTNSFINFLVYALRMPEFRKEVYKIISKCRHVTRTCIASPQEDAPYYLNTAAFKGEPALIMLKTLPPVQGINSLPFAEKPR